MFQRPPSKAEKGDVSLSNNTCTTDADCAYWAPECWCVRPHECPTFPSPHLLHTKAPLLRLLPSIHPAVRAPDVPFTPTQHPSTHTHTQPLCFLPSFLPPRPSLFASTAMKNHLIQRRVLLFRLGECSGIGGTLTPFTFTFIPFTPFAVSLSLSLSPSPNVTRRMHAVVGTMPLFAFAAVTRW